MWAALGPTLGVCNCCNLTDVEMQDFYQASGLADRSGPGADEMKWQLGRDSAVLELRLALPSEERGSYLDATFQVP